MNSKSVFLKDIELVKQWRAIAPTEWFSKVLIFARGELSETTGITPEALKGAKQLENILLGLASEEEEIPNEFGPRLEHNIDTPTRKKPSRKRHHPAFPEETVKG